MAVEKIPAEVLVVFNRDKTVKGVSLSQHTFVDGEFMRTSDATHVDAFSDPAIQESLPGFNVSTVLQRDELKRQLNETKQQLQAAIEDRDAAKNESEKLNQKYSDYDLLKTNYDLVLDENSRLKKQLDSIEANRS